MEPDLRVLIVDDDEGIRTMLSRLFAAEGMQVIAAGDGDLALTALGTWDFDLIVLDWMLPTVSGEEVLRAIRADAGTALVPVLVLSAWLPALGVPTADATLAKPFRLDDLWSKVLSLVKRRVVR